MREIEFNKNWWLKWYWPHIGKIYDVEAHYGTRQSGKTHQIARKLIRHSFLPAQFNVVHCRKEANKIEGSTFKILKNIITSNFKDDFIVTKGHFEIINKHTGNWFRGLGMDDPENAKSIEGANIAWMNEANQFTIEDYDFIGTTLRGNTGVAISIILDWNPQSVAHWLKSESEKIAKSQNSVLLKSTFWDNYLIDREALEARFLNIKARGPEGENLYRVWAKGDWGIEDTEKLFIRNFSRDRHVKPVKFDKNKDVYLAFDLNYDPTCLVIQLKDDMSPHVYREYGTKGMTLPFVCAAAKRDFPGFYIINGDASGNHSRNLTDNASSYDIIKNCLNLSLSQFNVPKANPSHKHSRLQCNALMDFTGATIDPSCINLIADIESAIVDERGSLDAWKKENPTRSHWIDPFRYHANAEHQRLFEQIGFGELLNS